MSLRRGLASAALAGFVSLAAQQPFSPPPPPEQPLPYSHKLHAGALRLACDRCHTNPDPGEIMGIPEATACMECHKTVRADSPHIRKLADYAERRAEIPWVRVYRIPSYVFFSHRAHLETGAVCATCHGPVTESEALRQETDISMGGCMDCHRKNQASIDCTYCHESLE